MTVQVDSAGQRFVDVPVLAGAHVRATFVAADKAGCGEDAIRIQVREPNGHLRQGPEIPLRSVGPMLSAIVDLLREEP